MNLDWLPQLLTLGVMTQHHNHHDGDGEETPVDTITFKADTVIRLLWFVLAIGGAGLLSATKFAWQANEERRNMVEAINGLTQRVEAAQHDRWTGAMQHTYMDQMKRNNPALSVPDSDAIQQRLTK